MTIWHDIYISDKTGIKAFRGDCSEMSLDGQIRELQRHLDAVKAKNKAYERVGVDPESCFIMVDGQRLQTMEEIFKDLENELDK